MFIMSRFSCRGIPGEGITTEIRAKIIDMKGTMVIMVKGKGIPILIQGRGFPAMASLTNKVRCLSDFFYSDAFTR